MFASYPPPFLARIGLTDTLELRLGSDVRISSQADGVTTQGWADTSVALRYRLQELDDKTNTAGMALQLEQGLPTGSAAFRADGGRTALKFAYERALPDNMSIGVMPGVVRQRNADGAWFVAPSLAITLGKNWTPVFRTTAEIVAPQITSTANGGKVATANLGATYRLTEMFELEVGYARGLTKNTPDHSAVVGLNIKL